MKRDLIFAKKIQIAEKKPDIFRNHFELDYLFSIPENIESHISAATGSTGVAATSSLTRISGLFCTGTGHEEVSFTKETGRFCPKLLGLS